MGVQATSKVRTSSAKRHGMMHAAVVWIEIPTKDVPGSARFYERVFGWSVFADDNTPGYERFLDRSGHMAGAFTLQGEPAGARGVRVVIQVDDLRNTLERVLREGGRVVAEPSIEPMGSGLWASFEDPAGNVLSIYGGPDRL